MAMNKQNFIVSILGKNVATNKTEQNASSVRSQNSDIHGDFRPNSKEHIAEKLRSLARNAAAEYEGRGEPIPAYVRSAMYCGLNGGGSWKKPTTIFGKRLHGGFRERLIRAFPHCATILALGVLIPICILKLHGQDEGKVQQELQHEVQGLRQQNDEIKQQLAKLSIDPTIIDKLVSQRHREELNYRDLKAEFKRQHNELLALQLTGAVKASQASTLQTTWQIYKHLQALPIPATVDAQPRLLQTIRMRETSNNNSLQLVDIASRTWIGWAIYKDEKNSNLVTSKRDKLDLDSQQDNYQARSAAMEKVPRQRPQDSIQEVIKQGDRLAHTLNLYQQKPQVLETVGPKSSLDMNAAEQSPCNTHNCSM